MNEAYHTTEQAVPTGEERKALREELLGVNAQNMLEFQNWAVQKFGPAAGIFIRQLVFWDGERSAAGQGWMWKSRREMQQETGLSQRQQEKAWKALKAKGYLEEEIRPVGPLKRPTLHYKPDLRRLFVLRFPRKNPTGTPIVNPVPEPLKEIQYRTPQGASALQDSSSLEHCLVAPH